MFDAVSDFLSDNVASLRLSRTQDGYFVVEAEVVRGSDIITYRYTDKSLESALSKTSLALFYFDSATTLST